MFERRTELEPQSCPSFIEIVRGSRRLRISANKALDRLYASARRRCAIEVGYPCGPVRVTIFDGSTGDRFEYVEFAKTGERTRAVLTRWHLRLAKPRELPPRVRGFVDFLFERAMERWDNTTS